MLFSDKVDEVFANINSHKDIFEFDYKIYKGTSFIKIEDLISNLPIKTDWSNDSIRARDFATIIRSGTSTDYRYIIWEHTCNHNIHFKITMYSKCDGNIFKYFIVLENFNYTDFKMDYKANLNIYDLYQYFKLYKNIKRYNFFE